MPRLRKHSPPSEIQKIIYIVDDDAVTDSLRALRETFGFDVQSYSSGNEFLADDPTILISGRLDNLTRQRATHLGVRELLDKPVAAGRLIQAIRTTLAEVG